MWAFEDEITVIQSPAIKEAFFTLFEMRNIEMAKCPVCETILLTRNTLHQNNQDDLLNQLTASGSFICMNKYCPLYKTTVYAVVNNTKIYLENCEEINIEKLKTTYKL